MVYASKVLKSQLDLSLYKKSVHDSYWGVNYEHHKKASSQLRINRKMEKIVGYAKARKDLLDIGCSYGAFLDVAKNYFGLCEGIEVNEKTAKIAKNAGFKIYTRPIEELRVKRTYDVVVIDQLIEHIYNLDYFMSNVKRMLKKCGMLFISCPNLDSFGFKIFKKHHIQIFERFHVNLFTPKTLKKLLEKHGFKVKDLTSDDTLDVSPTDLFAFMFNRANFIHTINDCNHISRLTDKIMQKLISITHLLSFANKGMYLEAVAIKR